ncbi:MAG: hypothetical protein AAGD22_12885 [Verrucomicrobiota bacterium]
MKEWRNRGLTIVGSALSGIIVGWFAHSTLVSKEESSTNPSDTARNDFDDRIIGRAPDSPQRPDGARVSSKPQTKTSSASDLEQTFALPRRYFDSSVVRTLDDDLRVTDEAAELFRLDQPTRSQLQGVMDGLRAQIQEKETQHMQGFQNETQAVVVITPWNHNPDVLRDQIRGEVTDLLGEVEGEFFFGQSQDVLNTVSSHYGQWYQVIKIKPRDDGRYNVQTTTTRDISVAPNEILTSSSVHFGPASISNSTHDNIPERFAHLFEED